MLAWIGLAFSLCAQAAQPYLLDPPARLNPPVEVRSLMGATYTYRGDDIEASLSLMITTMPAADIRQRIGALSEVQCINLFLEELRNTHARFFVASMVRPLVVGAQEFPQFRWTGDKGGRTLTGVLSCGLIGSNYYVVHFVDDLHRATHSFVEIRASLKSLRAITP